MLFGWLEQIKDRSESSTSGHMTLGNLCALSSAENTDKTCHVGICRTATRTSRVNLFNKTVLQSCADHKLCQHSAQITQSSRAHSATIQCSTDAQESDAWRITTSSLQSHPWSAWRWVCQDSCSSSPYLSHTFPNVPHCLELSNL